MVLTVPDANPPVPSASSHSALFSAITDSPLHSMHRPEKRGRVYFMFVRTRTPGSGLSDVLRTGQRRHAYSLATCHPWSPSLTVAHVGPPSRPVPLNSTSMARPARSASSIKLQRDRRQRNLCPPAPARFGLTGVGAGVDVDEAGRWRSLRVRSKEVRRAVRLRADPHGKFEQQRRTRGRHRRGQVVPARAARETRRLPAGSRPRIRSVSSCSADPRPMTSSPLVTARTSRGRAAAARRPRGTARVAAASAPA